MLAVLIGGYWAVREGVPRLARLTGERFEFTPARDLEGFRTLGSGPVSGGIDIFAGIDQPGQDQTRPVPREIDLTGRFCDTLFRGPGPGNGVMPIASFSDYFCPYCRVLTQRLADREATSGGTVRIAWHEWPILGPASTMAARGALAAKRQGAYVAFHKHLMRARFQATPEYLARVAETLGLSTERLLSDLSSPSIDRELAESRQLAVRLGLVGTPAIVVGRTIVQGVISEADLDALIALELEEGPILSCP